MNNLIVVLGWLASGDVIWPLVGLAVKCGFISVLALAVARLINSALPQIRNLVLRLGLLLTVVIPLTATAVALWQYWRPESSPILWQIVLPPVEVLGAAAIAGGTPVPTWSYWPLLPQAILAGGIGFALARIIIGIVMTRRLIRRALHNDSSALRSALERCARRIDVRSKVRAAFSLEIAIPFAAGLRNSTIILPDAARLWPAEELAMVISHELLHLKRRDHHWAVLGSIAVAVNWYNPLVWLVRRQMLLEAERCCDDGVLDTGVNAADYAELLVSLARISAPPRAIVAYGSQILGAKQLEERIMSILQARARSLRNLTPLLRLIAVAICLLLLPLAAIQLVGADKPATTPAKSTAADSSDWPSPGEFVEVTDQPIKIKDVLPVYPDSARRVGLEGNVWVKALIDTSGSVVKAMVLKTSGHKCFDDSALDATRQTVWKPATLDGKPTPIWVSYEIRFKLGDKKKP